MIIFKKPILTISFILTIAFRTSASEPIKLSDKVYLSTRVYGLLESYAMESSKPDDPLGQRFINIYPDLLSANNLELFNSYLDKLISTPSVNIDDSLIQDFSQGYLSFKSFEKVTDSEDYAISPDFDWIGDSRLSESVRYKLIKILEEYKPFKRSNIKKRGKEVLHIDDYSNLSGDSVAIYSLGMIKFWNKIFYYFPYLKLMDKPWDDVLKLESMLFLGMKTKKDYYQNLALLGAYLDDSHGFVSVNEYQKWSYGFGVWQTFPVDAQIFNGQAIISGIATKTELQNLSKGDTISHFNGIPTSKYLRDLSKTIIASNAEDSLRQLSKKLLQSYNHPDLGESVMTIRVNGMDYSLRTEPVYYADYLKFYNKEPPTEHQQVVEDISERIGYINLIHNKGKEVNKAFKLFREKEYLILDLRGYPPSSLAIFLAKNLSKKAKPVGSFYFPFYEYPGFFKDFKKSISYYISNQFDFILFALHTSKGKTMPTSRKPYPGKIIVLVNEFAISYAETIGMMIKSYRPNSIFIGRPSNGANGNVVDIPLPFDVTVSITGLHWHYPDGSQLQRKGLELDYYVPKKLEEIVSPVDVILNQALNLIENNQLKD